ncbi:MAG: hypothetical protein K2X03_28130 [Bryobacteraceae bacterium]|nr:hypothetical protein [Bryobacteraceae bacterium]
MPRLLSLLLLLAAPLAFAQPPKQVLAILSVKSGITRDAVMKVMQDEVKDTVKLYLAGKIQQWFGRQDGKGVVFILACDDAAAAKAITDELPLIKAGLAEFTFLPIGPLTPLRALLGEPAIK